MTPADVFQRARAPEPIVFRGDDLAFAIFSKDDRYRYALARHWQTKKPPLAVCMLNPSTADERQNDPTIRRCLSFAARGGYGGLVVVNLFALRATDPKALKTATDPVGPCSDWMIRQLDPSWDVLAAWGATSWPFVQARARHVAAMRSPWKSFGTTKDGHPRHPLYIPSKTEIAPWQPASV